MLPIRLLLACIFTLAFSPALHAQTTPSVTTEAVTNLTSTSVTLNETVNPNGSATSAYFVVNGALDFVSIVPAGNAPVPVALNLTITPGQAYDVYSYAINATGPTSGNVVHFVAPGGLPVVTTEAVTNLTSTSVTLNETVNPNGSATSAYFVVNGALDFVSIVPAGNAPVPVALNLTITPGQAYDVYSYAINATGPTSGNVVHFVAPGGLPVVTTEAVTNLTSTSVTLNETVNPNGSATSAYFVVNGALDFVSIVPAGNAPVPVALNLTITPGQAYDVYSYAINATGPTSGNVVHFVAPGGLPVVTTEAVTNLTPTSVTLNGTVNPNESATSAYFMVNGGLHLVGIVPAGNAPVPVALNLTITPGQAYDVYSYAINAAGPTSGNVVHFVALGGPPIVATGAVTNLTSTSVTLNGTVNPNESATSAYFNVNGVLTFVGIVPAGNAPVPVPLNLALVPGQAYDVYCSAINAAGSTSGNVVHFVAPGLPPNVTTGAVTNLTSTSVTLNGTVNPNEAETNVSFVVNGSFHFAANVGTGNAPVPVAYNFPLTPGQAYDVYCYAINAGGPASGNVVHFVAPGGLPVVTTEAITNLTSTSVTLNGTVNPNESATSAYFNVNGVLTFVGIVPAGNAPVPVPLNLALIPGQAYDVYCSAINAAGPASGNMVHFVAPGGLPVVTTEAITNLTSTSVTLNETVNPNESATSAYFVVNGALDFVSIVPAGNAPVPVALNLTITPGQAYDVYCYAINAAGSASGNVVHFVAPGGLPVVTTGAVTNLTSTSVTLNATVHPNEAETNVSFVVNGSFHFAANVGAGNAPVPVAYNFPLTPGQTYDVYCYASNAAGPTSGNVVQFVAPDGLPVVTTGAVSNLTSTSATLNGTVNPNEAETTAYFEYGLTTGYGSTTQIQNLGNGTSALPLSATVTGLLGNKTYHFRAVATNGTGTREGNDAMFTTGDSNPEPGSDVILIVTNPTRTINPLGNDNDPDGDAPLTITGTTNGARGTVGFTGTSVTYTATTLGNGTDTFTYTVGDGFGGSAPGTVKVYSVGSQAGFYSGFIDDADVVEGASQITMSSSGKLTGRIYFHGLKYSFKGQLDDNGEAAIQISRNAQALVVLHLTLLPGDAPSFSVSIEENNSITGTGEANRSGTQVPGKGHYTILLPPDPAQTGAEYPQGIGYATVNITTKGKISIAGAMGDGARFSTAASLRTDNTFLLFAPIYGAPRGEVYGTLTLRDVPGVSDLDGPLTWVKPRQTHLRPQQPNGFNTTTAAIGSRYVKGNGVNAMLTYNATGDATLDFSAGNLAAPLLSAIHVGALNPPSVAPPVLGMKFTITNGRFTGTFTRPGAVKTKFQGVVLPKQNRGAGFFIGNTQSGTVDLTPSP